LNPFPETNSPPAFLTAEQNSHKIQTMKTGARTTNEVRVKLSKGLYRRVERAARINRCKHSDIIAAALDSSLAVAPRNLPRNLANELTSWTFLDDEALRAIAAAFLPKWRQRRFTSLLRKHEAGKLNEQERTEWETLQQEYLRVSRNKAKAQYLLNQREKARAA
jgi:SLT domain-containing protein